MNKVGEEQNDNQKANGNNGEVEPKAAEKEARAPAASSVEPEVAEQEARAHAAAEQEARAPATKVRTAGPEDPPCLLIPIVRFVGALGRWAVPSQPSRVKPEVAEQEARAPAVAEQEARYPATTVHTAGPEDRPCLPIFKLLVSGALGRRAVPLQPRAFQSALRRR